MLNGTPTNKAFEINSLRDLEKIPLDRLDDFLFAMKQTLEDHRRLKIEAAAEGYLLVYNGMIWFDDGDTKLLPAIIREY